MPRYVKRSSRRRPYRRRRNYRKKTTPSSASGPLSNSLVSKLIYSDTVSIDPTVGGLAATHVISANGIYDPDITGIGHQPRGFDEMMELYEDATVIGSKITCYVANGDVNEGNLCALSLRNTSTPQTSPSDIMEYRFIKTKVLGTEAGVNAGVLSMKCNPNKFLHKSKPLSEDNLKNSNSSNPTEQCYFHISVLPTLAGDNSDPVHVVYRVEYQVVFSKPKPLLVS